MVSYDPSADPRSLATPPDPQELAHADAEAARLSRLLETLNARMVIFERPEWAEVYDIIEEQREHAASRMLHGACKTAGEFEHERGRVRMADTLLKLPESTRVHREEVIQELRSLSDDGSR